MNKTILLYITLLIFSVGFLSCSNEDESINIENPKEVSLVISPSGSSRAKTVDADNLESEQTINNLSIFLTKPSSTVIVDKYIHYNFSSIADNRKMVTLPLDPAVIKQKDIYIVANHDDISLLNSYTTISNLMNLATPVADANNLLIPENGFSMFGSTLNYDFTSGNQALVSLVRTVGKMRIKLTFPNATYVGTNNTFRVENAAKYTFISSDATLTVPDDAYFNYSTDIAFTETSAQEYNAITYLYEAVGEVPVLKIQSFLNNTTQSFSLNLPAPRRNYLYDIEVEIYPGVQGVNSNLKSTIMPEMKANITVK